MLSHNDAVQIVKLYKIGILKHELTEYLLTHCITSFQVVDEDLPALHLPNDIHCDFDRDEQDGAVEGVLVDALDDLAAEAIENFHLLSIYTHTDRQADTRIVSFS